MTIPIIGKKSRIIIGFNQLDGAGFGQQSGKENCFGRLFQKKREFIKLTNSLSFLAGSTGLEPAASGVTGRRYNRLNYDPDKRNGRRNRI